MNTRTINNLLEYYQWIKSSINEEPPPHPFYYRGQSDSGWGITASIFRKSEVPIKEKDLIKEAKKRLWFDLRKFETNLDKLVFLQHYGMATRLLDITFNPLVALYFACSQRDKDGTVFRGGRTKLEDNKTAEHTANYLFDYCEKGQNYGIDSFRMFLEKNDIKEDFPYYTSPVIVRPSLSNTRIIHQSGAFILSPLFQKKEGTDYSNLFCDSIDDRQMFSQKCIIPSKCKDAIRKELNQLNINEGTIFADTSSIIKTIMQEHIWKQDFINNILL